jgi:hypothetical protein
VTWLDLVGLARLGPVVIATTTYSITREASEWMSLLTS